MKRFILALLALLGLVAQAAPAQARVCGGSRTEVGAVVALGAPGQGLVAQEQACKTVSLRPVGDQANAAHQAFENASAPLTATVQLQADRARE